MYNTCITHVLHMHYTCIIHVLYIIKIIENDNFSDEYANKVQGLLCDKYITPSTHNPFENTYRKAARNTQFMGQLHDFAITKTARKFFDSLYTLVPQQKNTLLYYRFEEVKDD